MQIFFITKPITGYISLALLLTGWALALFQAPVDQAQGDVYRIIFLHVPAAFSAFSSSLLLCIFSVASMKTLKERYLINARATAEVGLLFTVLTLMTGSIWGYPTWGTWWTWDARLTTTFILAILYAAYIILHSNYDTGLARIKSCGVLGILIFADVPIIYKSVEIWRTLHQPPSLLRKGGSTMAPEILQVLLFCIAATILFALWLIFERSKVLTKKNQIQLKSQN